MTDEQAIRESTLWAVIRLLKKRNILVHDHPIYRGYCQGCLLQKAILALKVVSPSGVEE